MGVTPFLLTVVASAVLSSLITSVVNAAQLEAAIATANSNTIISVDANITAGTCWWFNRVAQ